jgi:hypothetical protein
LARLERILAQRAAKWLVPQIVIAYDDSQIVPGAAEKMKFFIWSRRANRQARSIRPWSTPKG